MRGKRATSRWGGAAEQCCVIDERRPAATHSHDALLSGTPTVACDRRYAGDTDPWASYALSEHDAAELWTLLKRLERRGEVI